MTVERIDPATGEVIELTEAEARRLTDRIRTALDRVSTAWADLAERITEAYQRRADLALGYGSWSEYAEAELKPSEGLAADVRRQLVGMLSARGVGPRAIAPVVGVTDRRVRQIRTDVEQGGSDFHPDEPESLDERIDRETGEVLPMTPTTELEAPSAPAEVLSAGSVGVAAPPAPRSVVGLDGKTYTRPQTTGPKEAQKETPMTAAPSRLAIPQPPRYGGNRLKHDRIISNAVIAASGLCSALDEITELDGSLDSEEAARLADDLSNILRSLKRIQSLIKKEV